MSRPRHAITLLTLALLISGTGLATFALADDTPMLARVYHQEISFVLPDGFTQVYEHTGERSFIRESVPDGETYDEWTEMITLTSNNNVAVDADVTPVSYANVFGEGFEKNCPSTYKAQEIDTTTITDRPAFIAYFSCGTVDSAPEPRSESAVVIFIKGHKDYSTLQWAERGDAVDGQIAFDDAIWKERMRSLFPVVICDIPPDDADVERGCEDKAE